MQSESFPEEHHKVTSIYFFLHPPNCTFVLIWLLGQHRPQLHADASSILKASSRIFSPLTVTVEGSNTGVLGLSGSTGLGGGAGAAAAAALGSSFFLGAILVARRSDRQQKILAAFMSRVHLCFIPRAPTPCTITFPAGLPTIDAQL